MKFLSFLHSFWREQKASTSIALGITFTMILGASVAAVEIEQMRKARSVMQTRLDATILYLGNTDAVTTPQNTGEAHLRALVKATDLNIASLNPVFQYEAATGNVKGTVDFELKGIMSGGMVSNYALQVKAGATPRTKGKIEIAMVLDVSGSMGWGFTNQRDANRGSRRIDGMLEAAEAMFDKIYENPHAIPSVAVIPYANSVDISDLFAATSQGTRASHYRNTNGNNAFTQVGMNTVDFGRSGFLSLKDLSPNDLTPNNRSNTMGVWAAERYTNKRGDGFYDVSLNQPHASHKVPVFTEESSYLWTDRNYDRWYGSDTIKVTRYWGRYYLGGSLYPTIGVLPMTTDTQAVRDYVAAFEPNGGTAGHIGAAWGLYALSPEWNDVFDHPAGSPVSWDDTTEKYLVFMSDGQFNSQQDASMDNDDIYNYFQSICTKARDQGVRVFTVGLLLDTKTEQELSKCSGYTGKFYPVDNRLELVNAFKAVGREAGQLRLQY